MKTRYTLFLLASLFLLSCGVKEKNNEAEQNANAFYNAVKEGNFDNALQEFSKEAFDSLGLQKVMSALHNKQALLGNVQTYEKQSGWNIHTSTDNGTTVNVKYLVEYEHGRSMDSLVFLKETDGQMHIVSYNWNYEQADYVDNIHKSEALAKSYMQTVADGYFEQSYAYVGYHGLDAAHIDEWTGMLKTTSTAKGKVLEYNVDVKSSAVDVYGTEAKIPGNYYTIIVQTNCTGGAIKETLLFYQPDYSSELKLVNHGRMAM